MLESVLLKLDFVKSVLVMVACGVLAVLRGVELQLVVHVGCDGCGEPSMLELMEPSRSAEEWFDVIEID